MDLGTFVYSVSTYVPFSFTSVLNFVVHVPSCLRGSEIFSLGYFVIPKFFLVAISWVQNFFSWALRRPKFFSRGYFLGPKLFSSVFCWSKFFSWVFHGSRIFFSSVFCGPKIFSRGYIVGLKYFPVGISVCSF